VKLESDSPIVVRINVNKELHEPRIFSPEPLESNGSRVGRRKFVF
jgi:hypothetical protein